MERSPIAQLHARQEKTGATGGCSVPLRIGVFSDDGPASISETSTQHCAMCEPEQ
jgi:hypothetical protein